MKSIEKWLRRVCGEALAIIVVVVTISGGLTVGGAEVELLVKCEGGPSGEKARAADTAAGGTTVRRFEALGWHLVRLPEGVTSAQAMARYRAQPGVLNVELNQSAVRRPEPVPPPVAIAPEEEDATLQSAATAPTRVVPNDPRYASQWNLKKIGMETAWGITTGSTNVVVAVIDTGVNYLHPDLAANMWRNPGETGLDTQSRDKATNGVDDDANGYIDDVHGIDVQKHTGDPMEIGFTRPGMTTPHPHGTASAGIIAALGNNSIGVAGINWQASIMAVKLNGGDQQANYNSDKASILESIDYLIQTKRRGVNLRVASNSYYDDIVSEAVYEALRLAGNEGILFVYSAANEGVNLDTTQWHTTTEDLFNIITVGGSDRSDGLLYSGSSYFFRGEKPHRSLIFQWFSSLR